MGEISDAMICGELCAMCGCHLEPGEIVYPQEQDDSAYMPIDGTGFGIPVECEDCYRYRVNQ